MPGQKKAQSNAAVVPYNYGLNPFGAGNNLNTIFHYTDSYVQAYSQYPFRTTGHLAFVAADGNSYRCSAALISAAILATAGHCVHQGGDNGGPRANGWIRSAYFVPARANTSWPYGYAWAVWATTTSGWYNVGNITQGYDIALLVLRDREGFSLPPGNYVGWLGACFSFCLQPYWYLTQLGYPGNYYGGLYMMQGEHLETNRNNTDYYHGSGMQGGSSGGPHVANLGFLSDSTANKGQWPYRDILFAATSWGYVSDVYKIQGASTTSGPGNSNNFPAMWTNACNVARGLHGNGTC
jgi:V8-like Glu-specific endopeptidase